ncbi:MAG: DUF4214 domain-containing protein [Nitrospirae bacterium]|nr:DUF4214 domain-containing protein [Nitrospirota bacterium]
MKSIKLFVACVLSLVLVFIIMLIIGSKEAYAVTQYAQRCASNQDFVTSLYNSILKRSPDSEGYRNWVDFLSKGANREDVISKFFESQEYQGFGRSNRDYARDLYNGILGRDPDSGGHDYWTHALDTGMSKAEVMRRFFESPEYKGIIEQCNKLR